MTRLFISHSSRNNDKAVEVQDWLAANGWDDVFLDLDPERGIVAGQRWKEALQKAAYRCEVVLALISAEWLASNWCKSEMDAARLMGKKIIVALIGIDKSQVPLDLMDEQVIDLSGDPQAYPRLKEGLKHAGLDPLSFPFEPGRRPYPGFAYFEEQDAAVFFGRDAQIVRGLDEIRRLVRTGVSRMLVILGASGSGKSSYLRAGLWPRLKRDDRAWLPLPVIRPERAVISGKYGLAQALQQVMSEARFAGGIRQRGLPRSRADIEEFIERTGDGLVKLFDALRDIGQVPGLSGENTSPSTIVLALDQGEELFNEEGRDEAERFVEILTSTLKADPRTLAILVMRSDSFPLVQAQPSLAALPKDPFTLDMMLEGSYRAVIEEPARLIQPTPLRIDPQLTDALLEEISGQDALPLLAFTLAHLFENYREDNELTLAGYDKLGRVKGVIDTAVKQALADGAAKGELPKDSKAQLALARAAFIPHLAQVSAAGQFVRRVATRDQIPAEARPLIDRFAEQRLLIKDRRNDAEVVEVAHEALLRQPPFSEWLEEDREFLVWRERLSQARAAFEADQRGLLAGRELEIARRWVKTRAASDIEAADQPFIRDSSAADDRRRAEEAENERRREAAEREEQERRIKDAEQIAAEQKKAALAQKRIAQRTRIGLGVVVLLLAAAAWQWWSTQKETISVLIQSSEAHFSANEDWDALITSLRAAHKFNTIPLVGVFYPAIRSQISQSLQEALYGIKEYKRLKFEVSGDVSHESTLGQIDWSPDGKSLAFLSGRDKVTVWRPDSNYLESIHPNRGDTGGEIRSVSWKPTPPNEETLAISSKNGSIEFFDPHGKHLLTSIKPVDDEFYGLSLTSIKPVDDEFYGLSWRPDGEELVLAGGKHGVVVFKPDGTPLANPLTNLKNDKWQVWSASWSPEPQHSLAAGGFTDPVKWENPDNASSPCSASPKSWIWSMSWSPDGESLAVGLGDNTVRLLSRDCKNERTLNGHTEPVSSVSWSRDGRLATASTQDRTVRLWNKEGTLLDTFHILTILGGVEWRPDGQVLATIDQYGLVRLWKDNPLLKTFAVPEHAGDTDAALSPDGHILASASGNLWWQDRDHWWPSEPASPPLKNVRSVSWSPPDGRLLASTSGDAVTVWNRDGTSKQTLQYDKHRTGLFRDVKNGVITVSWHPKGNAVATGDGEGNITLWDSNKGSILGQTSCNDWAQTISWNPVNDRLLAVGCHHKAGAYMLKWNPDKKKLHKKQLLPEVNILGVSWSRDGQILATSGNNRINLWRSDGTPIREVDTGDEVGGVAWSPDGTILAVASGNAVKLFKAVKSSEQDDLPITVLKGRAGVVKSVTWNKQTLVSSSDDGTVKLWQIGEGFADNLLEKLVGLSCNWLEGYFEEKNSWVSKEDSDLQDLCRNATLLPPDNEKALPALKPAQSPAAHEETKQNSVH